MARPRTRRFRLTFRGREDVRAEIREEFQFHLDMRVQELVRGGWTDAAARAQARREFGDDKAGLEVCARQDDAVERRRRWMLWLGDLRQDTTLGLRALRQSPGFAAIAILTLAIGIGANVAIFSALDAVLLRPLPYPDAERIVQVFETLENGSLNSVSGGAFRDWRDHGSHFDSLTLVAPVTFNLRSSASPERVSGLEVSHEFLRVLAVSPLLGRGFRPDDDRPGGDNNVVILTEGLWRSRFGGAPAILGTTVLLDEVPRTVIGVLPHGAWIFEEHQLFVPMVLLPNTVRYERAPHWGNVFGRLKPGVSVLAADAQLKTVKAQRAADYPRFKQKWSVAVRPLHDLLASDGRPILQLLLSAVAVVLLIACANVANLLLARACNREQEIALRTALGATRSRIARQVLTESVVLAAAGGAAGIALSYWGVEVLRQQTVDILPGAMTPQLDLRVLTFSVAITALTGILFGSLPAWRASRPDVSDTLKNGGKNATAGGRHRTQSLLVIGEVALTVVLLAVAGLLLRSLAKTTTVDPGFDPDRVLAFDLSLPRATYATGEQRLAFSRTLLERIRSVPGVEAAGASLAIPFSGGGSGEFVSRPGRSREADFFLGRIDFVSDGYLEALGTRLLAGRRLSPSDNVPTASRVTVVNETLARTLFPGENPIGQTVFVIGNVWEIVGVVADVVDRRLGTPARPFAYFAQAFNPSSFSVAIRSGVQPEGLIGVLRRELTRLDGGVALANARTLDSALSGSMKQQRFTLTLIATFASVALVLACIGLYGVLAYSVATRRRELSIRMALGAERGDVVRQILRQGLRMTALGVALGLICAAGAGRMLAGHLYQVRSDDPLALAGAVAALATVAFIACWLPAWKATRLNPIAALRND